MTDVSGGSAFNSFLLAVKGLKICQGLLEFGDTDLSRHFINLFWRNFTYLQELFFDNQFAETIFEIVNLIKH